MTGTSNTPLKDNVRGRAPFGPLLYDAMEAMPSTEGLNSQREDFLKGKPNVYGTLDRHLTALIACRASAEQYTELCNALHQGMLDKWTRAHPTVEAEDCVTPKELARAFALDEAAEGLEDVAEIDAVADFTNPDKLQKAFRHMSASHARKTFGLRVIATYLRRALGQQKAVAR